MLIENSESSVGVNLNEVCCFPLCGPAIKWQLVQIVTLCSPQRRWDRLQYPPAALTEGGLMTAIMRMGYCCQPLNYERN